jgi:uncharacterized repeat protein (TIGR01451 family)
MKRIVGFSLAVASLLGLVAPVTVMAQGLTITTQYPAITVDPGGTAKFDLLIQTATPERVDLTVTGTPDGWTARLHGGGSTISAVTTVATPAASGTTPQEPSATASLELSIPVDAAPNTYHVTVSGKSASGLTASLQVDMTIEQATAGSVTMNATNPQLQGHSGTTFNFDVSIKNDTNQEIDFALDVQGPEGWTVTATPQGAAQAATANVPAGQTGHVTVAAAAPDDAQADIYPITLTATGGPEQQSLDLSVEITGSYSISLATQDGRLNASATVGSDSPLNLIVTNTGTAPLTNVTLTSTPPNGWKVTFAPDKFDSLAANTPTNVIATIHPSDQAVAGDYVLTFRANSTTQGATASDSIDVRTTVQTSPIWGIVGILLIVLVLGGLLFVFRQYGRR